MANNGYVTSEIHDKICTIKFFSPKGNSLNSGFLFRLMKEFSDVDQNDDVNAVILRSEGEGAFCAGASLDELLTIDSYEKAKDFFYAFGKMLVSIIRCSKPVIARVHGKIVGGGVGLVSVCDYAIATKNASIRLSELSLGFGPFVISPFVIRKIGYSAFASISLDTDWRDAEWGKNFGLYSKVVDNSDEMDKEIENLKASFSRTNLNTLQKMKSIFWSDTENFEQIINTRSEISARLVLNEITSGRLQKVFKKDQ